MKTLFRSLLSGALVILGIPVIVFGFLSAAVASFFTVGVELFNYYTETSDPFKK